VDTQQLVDFLETAGRLKTLLRTGWVDSGIAAPESVADHSYRVTLLSMILADEEGLDSLRAVRMALLHDLAEAVVGDLTPMQKEGKTDWQMEERDAFRRLIVAVPDRLAEPYLDAVEEYLAGASPEARLVHAADKLEMLLQAREYEVAGYDSDRLMRFRHVSVEGELEKSIEFEIKSRMGKK